MTWIIASVLMFLSSYGIFPHYSTEQKEILDNYRKTTSNKVMEIANDDYILIEK